MTYTVERKTLIKIEPLILLIRWRCPPFIRGWRYTIATPWFCHTFGG